GHRDSRRPRPAAARVTFALPGERTMTGKVCRFKVLKGRAELSGLTSIPGVLAVWPNPHGEGVDRVDICLDRDEVTFPSVAEDQTIGNVILECAQSKSRY